MPRHAPLVPSLLATVVLVAACAGSASPSPSLTATPAPEAADLCAVAESGSFEFEAGRYRVNTTQPTLTFTLPAGYMAGCAEGAVTLFGPDGSISIIAPVAAVQVGPEQAPVDPTVEAVQAALIDGVVEATTVEPVTIDGLTGVEFVVTVDEVGIGLRSAAERGWGFNSDEFETGGISLFEVGGGVVGMIRHSDDPLATGDDVLASLDFESE